jgi:hypothetical protein
MNIPEPLGYGIVKGLGVVSIYSEDVGGLTLVARWVRTELVTDRAEHLTGGNVREMLDKLSGDSV